MEAHSDISKRTVLVLLILTLVISVVGTWTVLSQPTTIYKTVQLGGPESGKVMVGITEPSAPQAPAMSNEGGKVSINIAK
jgi:hypothetical protein